MTLFIEICTSKEKRDKFDLRMGNIDDYYIFNNITKKQIHKEIDKLIKKEKEIDERIRFI